MTSILYNPKLPEKSRQQIQYKLGLTKPTHKKEDVLK